MKKLILLVPVFLISFLLANNNMIENKEIARPEMVSPPSTSSSSESQSIKQRVEPTPMLDFEEESSTAKEGDFLTEDEGGSESDEGDGY